MPLQRLVAVWLFTELHWTYCCECLHWTDCWLLNAKELTRTLDLLFSISCAICLLQYCRPLLPPPGYIVITRVCWFVGLFVTLVVVSWKLQVLLLPPPKEEVMFSLRSVCLSVPSDNWKSCERILTKFLAGLAHGSSDQWVQFWWQSGSPSGCRSPISGFTVLSNWWNFMESWGVA